MALAIPLHPCSRIGQNKIMTVAAAEQQELRGMLDIRSYEWGAITVVCNGLAEALEQVLQSALCSLDQSWGQ
jgi:hypothetical protein